MNRINNLFLLIRNVLVSFIAFLRWLSEDKTTEQLTSVFATATKVATRVVRFYADNASTAQKAAKVICKAADELATVVPEFTKNCESYVADLSELQDSMKPKAAKAADRPKRKYTRRHASIAIATITKPAPRSASASSPVCTPADCKICDKAETCPKKGTWEADW